MVRLAGKSKSNSDPLGSAIPNLKENIPTIDELMRPPQPPPWWQLLPPPRHPDPNPFGPVPIIPSSPLEVDPPSRPPEWMFGPPYISRAPAQMPPSRQFASSTSGPAERIAAFKADFSAPVNPWRPYLFGTGVPQVSFVDAPSKEKPSGLLGLMTEAGMLDPSNSRQPQPGRLLGLIQEYMRNNPNGDAAD